MKMKHIRISDIEAGQRACIISIRVLKHWISKGNRPELCYLFVDKHGDGIDVVADLKHEAYFDSLITISSCYNITEYVAIPSRKSMSVISHKASIRIGLKAEFQLIQDENIPGFYYNFVDHEVLEECLRSWEILTDYIGRVLTNKLTEIKSKGITVRKLKIRDIRYNNKDVLITLWSDKKDLIDDKTTFGDIIALTSTRVTEYEGMKQLESTHLTSVVVNPRGASLKNFIDRLLQLQLSSSDNDDATPTTIQDLLQTTHQLNRVKNLTTTFFFTNQYSCLSNYLFTKLRSIQQQRKKFSCMCIISEVETHRNWYFAQCSECKNPLQLEHNGQPSFACVDHKIFTLNVQYCLNATITDDTGTTKVVIYNEAIMNFLKIECKLMVLDMGYHNPKALPPPVSAMIGTFFNFTLMVKTDRSVTITNISETQENTNATPLSSTTEKLPPPTPDPKSKRPIQQADEAEKELKTH